jgi:Na+/H+ antiporter NhaD/arsenite permease-like protein
MHTVQVDLYASIPFAIMLLFIAIGPLFFERWWENNRNKLIVALALSIPTFFYLTSRHLLHELDHQIFFDYVPFIILLTALFVVTGGIYLSGNIKAKPRTNLIFLLLGYLLASIMGTTGAAMLLIRPLLKTNAQRKYKTHTVLFFIATVANCGGLLTPLGDPPLFLLYLRGAPFAWFLTLFPQWLFVGASLLLIYYFVDRYYYKKEPVPDQRPEDACVARLRLGGGVNFVFIAIIVLSVAFVNKEFIPAMGAENAPVYMLFLREIILVGVIVVSLFTTRKGLRRLNRYSWGPIIEVTFVFLGIFVTMTPALLYMEENAAALGLTQPWQFYYSTGTMSAFLDNAPTAVAFHKLAVHGIDHTACESLVGELPPLFLQSIAVASVFFGSMTYIGNGPNFMVKSIAEHGGVKMPSFFAYIFTFSLLVLLPIYIISQLIFM